MSLRMESILVGRLSQVKEEERELLRGFRKIVRREQGETLNLAHEKSEVACWKDLLYLPDSSGTSFLTENRLVGTCIIL